jgi:hypothetical protein
MTRGEDFPGDLELAMTGFAWSAQPSLHLSRSKDRLAQFVMIFLEPGEALLEGADAFEEFRGNPGSQSLRVWDACQLGQGEVCPSAIGAALHVFGLAHRLFSSGYSSKTLGNQPTNLYPTP